MYAFMHEERSSRRGAEKNIQRDQLRWQGFGMERERGRIQSAYS